MDLPIADFAVKQGTMDRLGPAPDTYLVHRVPVLQTDRTKRDEQLVEVMSQGY